MYFFHHGFPIIIDSKEEYDQIVLCKSVVTLPEEEIGFLKGSLSEKSGLRYGCRPFNGGRIIFRSCGESIALQ